MESQHKPCSHACVCMHTHTYTISQLSCRIYKGWGQQTIMNRKINIYLLQQWRLSQSQQRYTSVYIAGETVRGKRVLWNRRSWKHWPLPQMQLKCKICSTVSVVMTIWHFLSLSTLFKSYWDNDWLILKGSVQWSDLQSCVKACL